jgi:NAD(P)-dependent dehydrogenase (short-subunit alcohol dehydrogenase family)
MPVQADLATTGGVDELWSSVQSMGSTLDIACVSAGVGVGGLFRETDLNEELNMINLNCSGTVLLAKYVVQHMLQQKSEKILFTASSAGATPTSFATRSKDEIAIRAKITNNDGGTVCSLCGEKNPLGNLRRISIQDVQSRARSSCVFTAVVRFCATATP